MKRLNVEKLQNEQTKIWYVQKNPKKKGSGSRDRYESYKHATTVGQALELGSYKNDLKHDFNRGFLHLEELEARPASSAKEREASPVYDFDDPIEDESPGAEARSSRKSASRQDFFQPFKKIKKGHTKMDEVVENEEPEVISNDVCHSSASQTGPRASELRRPASPLQCNQFTVGDLSRPQDIEDVMSQVEQNAKLFAAESGLVDEEVAPTEHEPSEEPSEAALFGSDQEEPQADHEEAEDFAADENAGLVKEEGLAAELEEASDGLVPISQCSQDEDAEEIILRCRLGLRVVKKEVEEPEGSTTKDLPKGDLRHFLQQRSESSGLGSEEDEHETNAEDENNEEKQAFESAQELSLEQNRSERQLRQERERDLLHQGSLEPLERLDEALMCAMFDAGLLTWLESEENRKLLYEYLELQTKAVAWYKEPAQVYFDARRRVMLSSLDQPDPAEAVAKFLEEEMATAQKALYCMPDKGYYVPSLFVPHDDLQGCVDLDE